MLEAAIPLAYNIVHHSDVERSSAAPGEIANVSNRAQAINLSSLLSRMIYYFFSQIDSGETVSISDSSAHDKIYNLLMAETSDLPAVSQAFYRANYNEVISGFGSKLRDAHSSKFYLTENRTISIVEDDIIATTELNQKSASTNELLYGRVCVERAMDNAVLPLLAAG